MALCQGFLCGACLSTSNKLDMTVFNELWDRENGTQSSMLLQIKDMTALPLQDLIKKTGENTRHTQGPFVPACQIESAIKQATPSSDSLLISKNINALLHASISWMQSSSLFSLSLASMSLKCFVNSAIAESTQNDYVALSDGFRVLWKQALSTCKGPQRGVIIFNSFSHISMSRRAAL